MNILLTLKNIINNTFKKYGINSLYNNILQFNFNKNVKYGHYQINGIMNLSKLTNIKYFYLFFIISTDFKLNIITQKIILENNTIINMTFKKSWLITLINKIINKYNISHFDYKKSKIILDYSSPNLAKTLHVGNLRSSIIGDAMANIYSYLGYKIIKFNHVGDWGTPIGMIIAYILFKNIKFNDYISLKDINTFYSSAQILFKKKHINFIHLTKKCLKYLHKKNPSIIFLWKKLVNLSLTENQEVYKNYKINLTYNNVCGESFYVDSLHKIVIDLQYKGLAIKSKGAIITNLSLAHNNENLITNLIIQKSDGSYLYSTTDLAAIKYRCDTFKPYKILYFIDVRQRQYLKHIWEIAKQAGYVTKNTSLEHHFFGMILDKQGQPFKSRKGEIITLQYFLNEAINKTTNFLNKKDRVNMTLEQSDNKNIKFNKFYTKSLIYKIAIGSIKYSELSRNRENNYIFNWKNLLTFEGNTVLYIQYAYCRINSILDKLNIDKYNLVNNKILDISNKEVQIILLIIRYEEILNTVLIYGYPHLLCNYLYKLTKEFTLFYETFNIINEYNLSCFYKRIQILILVENIIKSGMNLLGIKLSKMI